MLPSSHGTINSNLIQVDPVTEENKTQTGSRADVTDPGCSFAYAKTHKNEKFVFYNNRWF